MLQRGTPEPFYKSINYQFTVLGVDRQLFYLFTAICLSIAFSAHLSILMVIVALVIFTILYVIGVLITRVDNQILGIFRRHISYMNYYNYQPCLHAAIQIPKPSVPYYLGKRSLI